MFKKILLPVIALVLIFISVEAQNVRNRALEPAAAAATEAAKEVKKYDFTFEGDVACLNQLVVKGSSELTAEEAASKAEKGQPIGIITGGKFYFVFNTDGSYAGKILAKFAGKKVGIVGKKRTSNGMSFIMADLIKPVN